MPIHADLYQSSEFQAQFVRVQQRDFLENNAAVFQLLHPSGTGRSGQPHLFRQLLIADVSVLLQFLQMRRS